jgi:RNA polymerase sigma-70 factor (ECF subfamily)
MAILASLAEPAAAPSAEAIALADLELAQAWEKLTDKEREALALWALDGLEPHEVATALGISNNAANIRLSRAKKNLLAELEKSNPSTT